MNKMIWIQTLAIAGLVLLASCNQKDLDSPSILTSSVDSVVSVRSPHDMLASLEAYTGGISLANDNSVRGIYDQNKTSFSWTGSLDPNTAKAMKELVAIFCAKGRILRTTIIFGSFRVSVAPLKTDGSYNHSLIERTALVRNLILRATGEAATDEEANIVLSGFNDMLRIVPNSVTGTAQALDAVCTAVGASALSSIAF